MLHLLLYDHGGGGEEEEVKIDAITFKLINTDNFSNLISVTKSKRTHLWTSQDNNTVVKEPPMYIYMKNGAISSKHNYFVSALCIMLV